MSAKACSGVQGAETHPHGILEVVEWQGQLLHSWYAESGGAAAKCQHQPVILQALAIS